MLSLANVNGTGTCVLVTSGGEFSGRTVLIAGAGCAEGEALAAWFAGQGARLVVIDREEMRVLRIAEVAPARIEPLQLDVMRLRACEQLGEIWADEPLHFLVLLQLLRHAARPAEAMRSVRGLIRALGPGLAAGRAQVVYLFAGLKADADAEARGLQAAFFAMAQALQDETTAPGVSVNALMLPPDGSASDAESLGDAMRLIAGRGGARVGGAVLPLLPRAD